MKKITFNAPLNHKAYSYEPMQIEVEKVIPLYGKRFEQMRVNPLEDAPEITDNRDLMYTEGNTAHCIFFLDANGNDGILVEAEGADYARKSEFISNARAIIEANDFTFTSNHGYNKKEIVSQIISNYGCAPIFAFGDSSSDYEMMSMSQNSVLVSHGNNETEFVADVVISSQISEREIIDKLRRRLLR